MRKRKHPKAATAIKDNEKNAEPSISAKDLALLFYVLPEDEAVKDPSKKGQNVDWICFCGNSRTRSGTGYSNLTDHVKKAHQNYKFVYDEAVKMGWKPEVNTGKTYLDKICATLQSQSSLQLSMSAFVPFKAENIFCWLNWTVTDLQPFSFVENEQTRRYTRLNPISRKTLMKYMNLVTIQVEKKISSILPSRFGIVYDAWTSRAHHYIGTFATFSKQIRLLGFTLMDIPEGENEASFDSLAFVREFNDLLQFYNKTTDNIAVLTGDNCSVNKAISDLMEKPMVGCYSHRLNLAVNQYLEPYEPVLASIEALMVRLKNLKAAAELRLSTPLKPVLRNKTRWSSTHDMLLRYSQLFDHFNQADPELADVLLSPAQHRDALRLLPHLKKINIVTKMLQFHGITMSEARFYLDQLLHEYPTMQEYIGENARIMKHPVFESAVIKIQRHQDANLTDEEKKVMEPFLLPVVTERQQQAGDERVEAKSLEEDFAARLERDIKKLKCETEAKFVSAYVDLDFIAPVGNDCERLFSVAGRAYDKERGQIKPVNLESQIFLKSNRDLWDAQSVYDAMIAHKNPENTDEDFAVPKG